MAVWDKRDGIKHWFKTPKADFPTGSLVLGVLILGVGIVLAIAVNVIAGLVTAVVGVVVVVLWPFAPSGSQAHTRTFNLVTYGRAKKDYDSRASTGQMLAWLEEDFKARQKESIGKVGLDETELVADSVLITGPIAWDIRGLKPEETGLHRRVNEGDSLLFACWNVTVVHFSKQNMGIYTCVYNWLRDVAVGEGTYEYYYKDVVSVKTFVDSEADDKKQRMFAGQKLVESTTFRLSVSSGESVDVVIDDPHLKSVNSVELRTRGEKAVATVRQLLRQYKQ